MARLAATIAFLAVLIPTLAPASSASGTSASGSVTLMPNGDPADYKDVGFAALGLVLHPGDTLHFAWASNGGAGPEVFFEIHAHPPPAGYVRLYTLVAVQANSSWQVPGTDPYMVYWHNRGTVAANVTYAYDVTPPTELPLAGIGIASAAGGLAAVAIVLILLRRRRKKSANAPNPNPP